MFANVSVEIASSLPPSLLPLFLSASLPDFFSLSLTGSHVSQTNLKSTVYLKNDLQSLLFLLHLSNTGIASMCHYVWAMLYQRWNPGLHAC